MAKFNLLQALAGKEFYSKKFGEVKDWKYFDGAEDDQECIYVSFKEYPSIIRPYYKDGKYWHTASENDDHNLYMGSPDTFRYIVLLKEGNIPVTGNLWRGVDAAGMEARSIKNFETKVRLIDFSDKHYD